MRTFPKMPNLLIPALLCGLTFATSAWASDTPTTITEPVMRYGLGALQCAAYSKDGKYIVTGGGVGVILWNAETAERIRILRASEHDVTSVAFSPDGTKVLTAADYEATARLWDVATGLEIRTFSHHTNWVTSVAFSPDGTKVLTGNRDKTAKIWDASTGEEIRTFTGHFNWVNSVAFSPDGTKILTGSDDYRALLWDVETGTIIRGFFNYTYPVKSVAFSPDGTKLLTAEGPGVHLWSIAGGEIRVFRGHGTTVNHVVFSPDGTRVLSGSVDLTARLWDTATGAEVCSFSCGGRVNSVAFSPNGMKVLIASQDNIARLWDVTTHAEIRTFLGHTSYVSSVAFSPDGTKALTGSGDMTAKLWDASTGVLIRTFSGHSDSVNSVAFSPDGTRILTGSDDNTAKLWNVATGGETRTFVGHTSYTVSVAFSPDGTKALTGSYDKTAKLWDVATGVEINTFSGHSKPLHSVAFSPDGTKVLTGGWDDTAKLWNASTGVLIRTFFGYGGYCTAFSPDGTKALTGGYGNTAKLWDVATGALICKFSGHANEVYAVAFSPDGTKVLTGSGDHTSKLWDVTTGAEIRAFSGHTSYVYSVAFSPDGTNALTGSEDSTAKLWDTLTGREIHTFSGYTAWVTSVAFSPDGKKVLTGSHDMTAKLWDASTGAEIRTFSGHTSYINSVAFSPDGTKVLTGSSDKTAKLWNASTGAEIRTFSGHTYYVSSVAFSPDGTKVLTGSGDNTAKIWDASTGAEIRTFEHIFAVSSVVFSPDGTNALVELGADGSLFLWNVSDGVLIRTFHGAQDSGISVSFSPDGTKALGIGHLWNVADGSVLQEFRQTACAVFSPDGTKILTADGVIVNLRDTATGVVVRTFSGHTYLLNALAFSPDGTKVLTGGRDGLTLLWSISARTKDKLLLVAGGGNFSENSIAGQTQALAERAHLAATIRGYTNENILYLSAFDTPQTNLLVDGASSAAAIRDAVQNWASDAWRLTILLIDHGEQDPAAGDWYFLADGARTPRDFLTASSLDVALDAAQSTSDPLQEVCLMVDACYSGGFVRKCSGAPAGTKRLVIASTTDNRLANFGAANGALSFSNFFLSSAQEGQTIETCFQRAKNALDQLGLPSAAPQTPWLDDDGDGAYDPARDGSVARARVLGNIPLFGLWIPQVDDARANATLPFPEDFDLWCHIPPGAAEVKRSEAVVAYGGEQSPNGAPITDQLIVPLSQEVATNRWIGTLPASIFTRAGTYYILYTAWRDDGLGVDLAGYPLIRQVTVTSGGVPDAHKLILVAGGGPYAGNTIATQTLALTNSIHHVAAKRRFLPENVHYLSAFETPGTNPDVDGAASGAALRGALQSWAQGATHLTVALVGQTRYDGAASTWNYVVDATGAVADEVSAIEVDALLDTLQSGASGVPFVCLYVDSPYAGGFLKRCSGAPAGTKRVVIAGTTDTRTAVYAGEKGALSFTGFFLPSALQGNNLLQTFRSARNSLVALNLPADSPQNPWLDDNGDGAFDKSDGAVAALYHLGPGPAFGFLRPEITDARTTETVRVRADFQAWAEVGPGPVLRAEAVVSAVASGESSGGPVTQLGVYPLSREGATQRWSAMIPMTGLRNNADYMIAYVAYRDDGFGLEIASEPWTSLLGVSIRTEVDRKRWELYD